MEPQQIRGHAAGLSEAQDTMRRRDQRLENLGSSRQWSWRLLGRLIPLRRFLSPPEPQDLEWKARRIVFVEVSSRAVAVQDQS